MSGAGSSGGGALFLEQAEALDSQIEVEVLSGPEAPARFGIGWIGKGMAGLVGRRQLDGPAVGPEEGQFAVFRGESAEVAAFVDGAVVL